MEIINEEDYYASLSLPPLPPLSLRKNKLSKKKSTVCRLKKYKETKAERLLRALVTEVECVDLQNRLKQAIDDIITFFTENYDTLIDEFYELEHTKNELEYRLHIQSKHHERSLKEIQQFYKIQYENNPNMLFQQHGSRRSTASSILLPSNVSCISGRSYMSSSSARSSSCSSSMRTSFSHLMDEMIDPTMIREDSILLEKEENQHHPNEIDIYSVLSDSEAGHDPSNTTDSSKGDHTLSSLVQSPTVDDNELNTNNEISISKTKFENNNSEVTITTAKKEREEDALTFACGDGFWNTIARGKNNKTDVDTLIR
ncbi:uncharacterized protein BX663DRAFT_293287 [Cokeromyces recurvatus]|uniref:uncharacterized protein n=1 Tax=Cokeromyces recurvatus TaxID=90255 RepID=UPI00221E75F6|nr:uncharacterized protein BX663DRAFT_293287 [Cokeromyces recurvatus]KAI7905771.1 hypothetical protein BX663DRAFT_293287 [Cokeromyces recurvatus]